jgi:uncharacterized membrane protein YbhN (UPF0104 family)
MAVESREAPVLDPRDELEPPGSSRAVSSRLLGVFARRTITLAILAAVVVTVVFAVPSFGAVRRDIRDINLWWVLVAVALEVASCVSFVPLFGAFFDAIPRPVARRVAWIEEGSGALLPGGGVTSYALGGVFLHRAGMGVRQIVVRSGGVFWLTTAFNGFTIMLGVVLLLFGLAPGPRGFALTGLPLVIVVALTVAIAAAPALIRDRDRPTRRHQFLVGLIDGVGDAWRAARNPSWGLLGAIGYLGFDIAVLFCLFRGLGYHISCAVLILGYMIGYVATAIPIPAGIGVLEGGLVGVLVLYGAPAAPSAAAVLVYHAIALWIPSLGGVIAWADLNFRHPHP